MNDSNSTRRNFLKSSLLAGSSAALLGSTSLDSLLSAEGFGIRGIGDDRVLVVVQLSGGNDGLSMVVPHGDDSYHQLRRATRHQAKDVLQLDKYVGLNPGMKSLKSLYDGGNLAIIQGCSYPNPNRSHFKSMDIWQTSDLRGNGQPYGWIGRYADLHAAKLADPNYLVGIGKKAELALVGKRIKPVAFTTPESYRYVANEKQFETFDQLNDVATGKKEGNLDFLRRVSKNAKSSSYRIRRATTGYQTNINYGPGRGVGTDLRTAAAIIAAKIPTRVIYCTMGGYDTHVNQKGRHDNNMRQLDAALGAFQKDLARTGQADRVVTMVFSEFGRRVKENGSGGTDHGVAGPMMLLGNNIKGGLYGKHPSLTDLNNGDLKMTTDFRAVYATLLEDWMAAKATPLLGRTSRIKKLITTS